MTINVPLAIDIYHGDNVQDFPGKPLGGFELAKQSGIIGCIHKATEGETVFDKRYATRRKYWMDGGTITAHGVTTKPLWGAYHFFRGTNPKAEADHFLAVAEADAATLLALDWEGVGTAGYQPKADLAHAFLDRVYERMGRRAVIYSGNVAKEQIRGRNEFFGAHRLWLAQYGKIWRVQPSWQYPWLWQNNGDALGVGPHHIPGIDGNCDNNTWVSPTTPQKIIDEWAS